ncbi:MAG: histidinol-phosphate transaminase [Actinomycetota bacterium]
MTDPELRERMSGRSDLADLSPYRAPQLDAPVKLNTNESPYPPPGTFVRDLQARVAKLDLNRYPQRDFASVREAMAAHVGTLTERVWLANGSNEILLQLLLAFGGTERKVMTFEPTYGMHAHITKISGTRHLRAGRNPDYSLTAESCVDAIAAHRPDIVFLCSPNNPTGNSCSPDDIQSICKAASGMVILDEAYVEFSDTPNSSIQLLEECDNLVVTRSFSKSWRLAGARLGYLIASARIIEEIQKVRLPYHLSALSQAAALAALAHAEEIMATVETIQHERARVFRELSTMAGIVPFPSDANFILFRVASKPAGEVWQRLLEQGILIRDFSDVPRCEDCLRVSIGTPEQNEKFLDALAAEAVDR